MLIFLPYAHKGTTAHVVEPCISDLEKDICLFIVSDVLLSPNWCSACSS